VQRAVGVLTNATAADHWAYDYFYVKTDQKGKMLKINVAEIDYVEGNKNYTYINHKGNQKTMVLQTMKSIEERLSAQHFIRIHKSYIVAIQNITMLEGNTILLSHLGERLPIGDSYKAALLKAMEQRLL
jgi:two-component system, LytTR family, response regulator